MSEMPLLVETVTGRTMAELRAARDAARQADLVELRLDGTAGIDVAGALAGRQRPVIVTRRPRGGGGRVDGSEDDPGGILGEGPQRGAGDGDIQWRGGVGHAVPAPRGRARGWALPAFSG